MKLQPSLVVTRKIAAASPRAAHDEAQVESLAQLIVDAGGLTHPLIVERDGVDSYRLVEGELAYHAAARAKELDPLTAETVLAFIVEPQQAKVLKRQQSLLGGRPASTPAPVGVPTDAAFAARVEQRIDQQILGLKAFIQDGLLAKVPSRASALHTLNHGSDHEILRLMTATGANPGKLCTAIKEARPFGSYMEAVHRVKGLSAERMQKIQDFCEGNPIHEVEKPRRSRKKQLAEV
jgi:ParB family chromosome partitioning protein